MLKAHPEVHKFLEKTESPIIEERECYNWKFDGRKRPRKMV